jgi:serine/threonine protein phosphatase PrpC
LLPPAHPRAQKKCARAALDVVGGRTCGYAWFVVLFSTVVSVESGGRGEDRASVRQGSGQLLVVLADGAGGTGGGAAAAETVCHLALVEPRAQRPWTDVLRDIDLRLLRSGTGGLSTCVVVEVADGVVAGASVGDSGAWLVRAAAITDLTEAQETKPLLGSGAAQPAAIIPRPFAGRLLVASDGLFKYARRSEIQRRTLAMTLDECAASLLDCVRLRSGRFQDDVSIVLAEDRAAHV